VEVLVAAEIEPIDDREPRLGPSASATAMARFISKAMLALGCCLVCLRRLRCSP
jgi:hypothetical protein